MSDLRSLFPVLEDVGTGAGAALAKVQQGDAGAAKNGLIGFAFKDASGNVILPQLDAAGRIKVTSDVGATLVDAAKVAGSATEVEVAKITLTVNKVYTEISAHASCFRDAAFRIYHNDDGAETDLGFILCGPGDFTGEMLPMGLEVTAGATGTQEIVIKALNLNSLSDFRATIVAKEIA